MTKHLKKEIKHEILIILVKNLTGHNTTVQALAFDRNGMLASGAGDNTIKLWNTASGVLIRTLIGHINVV